MSGGHGGVDEIVGSPHPSPASTGCIDQVLDEPRILNNAAAWLLSRSGCVIMWGVVVLG